jgi:predicted ATPase/class 3 adenylate cyclase/DNA-binding CsgD family transcriptional regulator
MSQLPMGTVTLLFIDIEGSTRLLQQLGERYAEMLAECRQLLRAVFHRWHGHEVDTQGDAFFVAFARASDAVSAAVEMQRTLATHVWPNGVTVRMRIGLHTGEPQLSSEGYVGLDVHHAARIMIAGHGGQVLLSAATQELVKRDLPEGVSLRDLGEYRLKDLQHPSRLFQVVMADLQADFPPLKTLDSHPNNLPIQPTTLIGREKEMTAVERLLHREDVRLVTLTGLGGIGKTRLGLQVAAELSDHFPDGVYFVNLAPISDPAFVVSLIAQALEVKEISGQPLLDLLKASLREKQLLLLLDNFEQVVSAAVQVADLLAMCPKLKIMVTSRMALRVQAEHEFAVPPLALPDPNHVHDLVSLSQYEAVALFIARAQAVKPDFQVTNASAPTIAHICVRLEGLPLAIELAAARVKLLSPQALLARLDQRLAVLTSGARDAPTRQQTLRGTIKWSYDLLDAGEQRLFRHLSVFVGGCTFQAIEALSLQFEVEDTILPALNVVASLIDKNLLKQTISEDEEPRFTMLETIREFGLEALSENNELEATRSMHASYYLALAQEAEMQLAGSNQIEWLDRLEREHDNLRAVMEWSLGSELDEKNEQRSELGVRLGGVLHQFWIIHAHLNEGKTYLMRILEGSPNATSALRAKLLIAAADLALVMDDRQLGEPLADEALQLCEVVGDQEGIAFSKYLLGFFAIWKGEYTLARTQLEEGIALLRKLNRKERLGWSVYALGYLNTVQGDYLQSRACYEEALTLFRSIGNKEGIAAMLFMLARIHFYFLGDAVTALSLLNEVRTQMEALGEKWGVAYSFNLAAEIALYQGDFATAHSQAEAALVLNQELGQRAGIAKSLSLIAQVEARQKNFSAAQSLYEQILTLAEDMDDRLAIPTYLEQLAEVVATQGEVADASRLWGAAEFLRETIGSPMQPVYRTSHERAITAARTLLSEQAFAAAWAEGGNMTLEQALVTARQVAVSIPAYSQYTTTAATKPSRSYPAGLTIREVEVLRLVAQGMTNEQVAEQLVVSPRTVSTHLTSIYNKLGVNSRSAATRFAVEHQLI